MSAMKLGYKYYRNSLIKVMILSVAVLYVVWKHLRGRGIPNDQPRALILLAVVIMVASNVGLFIAMRRAKRREQAASLQKRISDDTKRAA